MNKMIDTNNNFLLTLLLLGKCLTKIINKTIQEENKFKDKKNYDEIENNIIIDTNYISNIQEKEPNKKIPSKINNGYNINKHNKVNYNINSTNNNNYYGKNKNDYSIDNPSDITNSNNHQQILAKNRRMLDLKLTTNIR